MLKYLVRKYYRPFGRKSRLIPAHELEHLYWSADADPETAKWRIDRRLDLDARVFLHPITLLITDRYDGCDSGIDNDYVVQIEKGTLREILSKIQKTVKKMDAHAENCGDHVHGDKVFFQGLVKVDDSAWGASLS